MNDRTPTPPLPARPYFSSGPCAKPPGWSPDKLDTRQSSAARIAARSASSGCKHCIDLMREMLALPDSHRIGIVPGSDTGAFEMAMWTMLGAAAGHHAGLGKLRRRLGDRRGQAVEARPDRDPRRLRRSCPTWRRSTGRTTCCSPGTAPPAGVRVPDAEWIAGRPRGPELRRRDQRGVRLRHRLGQDRCRHLQLAEGARRRRRRTAC